MEDADRYRCRRIYLRHSDDPARKAVSACGALINIDGILLATPVGENSVQVIYSLDKLGFELVMELLRELGFELNDSVLLSLRNAIYCFLEDNVRDNMQIELAEDARDDPEHSDSPPLDNDKYWEDYR